MRVKVEQSTEFERHKIMLEDQQRCIKKTIEWLKNPTQKYAVCNDRIGWASHNRYTDYFKNKGYRIGLLDPSGTMTVGIYFDNVKTE